MSKKLTLVLTVLLAAAITTPVRAWDNFWWYDHLAPPEETPGGDGLTPVSGDVKAVIVVGEVPDDAGDYGQGYYPALYDSLIAPSREAALNDSLYMWSITNFLKIA